MLFLRSLTRLRFDVLRHHEIQKLFRIQDTNIFFLSFIVSWCTNRSHRFFSKLLFEHSKSKMKKEHERVFFSFCFLHSFLFFLSSFLLLLDFSVKDRHMGLKWWYERESILGSLLVPSCCERARIRWTPRVVTSIRKLFYRRNILLLPFPLCWINPKTHEEKPQGVCSSFVTFFFLEWLLFFFLFSQNEFLSPGPWRLLSVFFFPFFPWVTRKFLGTVLNYNFQGFCLTVLHAVKKINVIFWGLYFSLSLFLSSFQKRVSKNNVMRHGVKKKRIEK